MTDFLARYRSSPQTSVLNGEFNLQIALDDQSEANMALVLAAEAENEGLLTSAKFLFDDALAWEEASMKGLLQAAERERKRIS